MVLELRDDEHVCVSEECESALSTLCPTPVANAYLLCVYIQYLTVGLPTSTTYVMMQCTVLLGMIHSTLCPTPVANAYLLCVPT